MGCSHVLCCQSYAFQHPNHPGLIRPGSLQVHDPCLQHLHPVCHGSPLGPESHLINSATDYLFRASHQLLFFLNKLAASMGIKRTLITSNKTRFSSIHASLEAVSRLQSVLQELVRQHPRLCCAAVMTTIGSDMFFVRLKQICRLLEPFTLVIVVVQTARATLDDAMRYWLFLAKQITHLNSESMPMEFKAHCFTAYSLRHNEIVNLVLKLGLFLHPLYRDVLSTHKENWVEVQRTAGNLWNNGYKKSS